jgi:hypothetical protein
MVQRVTVSEAAVALGISKSTVSRQSREWGLVGADRRFDLEAFRERRAAELNPLMVRGAPQEAQASLLTPISAAEPPPVARTASTTSEVAENKRLQNELLRRRIAEDDKLRVDIAVMVDLAVKVAAIARSEWSGLPAQVAVELARESDPDRIEVVLQARINEMLTSFCTALRKAAQPEGQGGAEAA